MRWIHHRGVLCTIGCAPFTDTGPPHVLDVTRDRHVVSAEYTVASLAVRPKIAKTEMDIYNFNKAAHKGWSVVIDQLLVEHLIRMTEGYVGSLRVLGLGVVLGVLGQLHSSDQSISCQPGHTPAHLNCDHYKPSTHKLPRQHGDLQGTI